MGKPEIAPRSPGARVGGRSRRPGPNWPPAGRPWGAGQGASPRRGLPARRPLAPGRGKQRPRPLRKRERGPEERTRSPGQGLQGALRPWPPPAPRPLLAAGPAGEPPSRTPPRPAGLVSRKSGPRLLTASRPRARVPSPSYSWLRGVDSPETRAEVWILNLLAGDYGKVT